MAEHSKAVKLLAGAWALTLLLISGFVIWLIFAEAPEPANNNSPPPARAEAILSKPQETAPEPTDSPAILPPVDLLQDDAPSSGEISDVATRPLEVSPELLQEEGPYGPLPRIGLDGSMARMVFANAGVYDAETPRVAIIVTSLGLGRAATEKALNRLPPSVTLAFSPYGYSLEEWSSKARTKGHELLMMVPMEPLNYPRNDPGPHVLLRDATVEANFDRLYYVLSRMSGYVGVVNIMGSRLTANEAAMRPILEEIRDRGLMFVDARATSYTIATRLAHDLGLPTAINSRYIDQVPAEADIRSALLELENTARTVGSSVGMARALPLTIDLIAEWATLAPERGIVLVPITAVANRQPVR